ncbi:hypothetical protein OIE63_23800 [Streptomyces sp. NBC_01795]|uniref:hypothetical protein n=1 Tax=Streptomyces sp. NBC_01795 TaxID=2975943 RepID=UPI002DD948DF|nr:hypothetical protein [Streptomyces sp. NBC_01795]WSA94262.1 hypothetical protein OIE63_23800 [Streptomyces sp. NBC_01795]
MRAHSPRRALAAASPRRALAAAVLVPALLVPLAACGDKDNGGGGSSSEGSDGGKGGKKGGSEQDTGGGAGDDGGGSGEDGKGGDSGKDGEGDKGDKGGDSGKDGEGDKGDKGGDSGLKPLTKPQLSEALLKTADVPGYRVQASDDALGEDDKGTPKTGPECRPLIDVFSLDSKQKRSAWVAETLLKGGKGEMNTQSSMHQVLLAAYGSGGAETFVNELKGAVETCHEITDPEEEGEKVTVAARPSPGLGDDSVQFVMGNSDMRSIKVLITVVRSGANTTTFMTTSLSGKQEAQPKALLDKQLAKLAAAGQGAGQG